SPNAYRSSERGSVSVAAGCCGLTLAPRRNRQTPSSPPSHHSTLCSSSNRSDRGKLLRTVWRPYQPSSRRSPYLRIVRRGSYCGNVGHHSPRLGMLILERATTSSRERLGRISTRAGQSPVLIRGTSPAESGL